MDMLRKIIEIGSNLSIICLVIIIAYFIMGSMATSSTASKPQTGATVGTRVPLSGVDFGRRERNLLMVLSTSCHFCTESMPFYERLVNKNSVGRGIRVIAAFPQSTEESTRYLADHNVTVDEVIKADPTEALVRGTPTLLLVDADGVVIESWAGKLSAEKEEEVLRRTIGQTTDGK